MAHSIQTARLLSRIPTRIPKDYQEKVLERLLPPRSALDRMSYDELTQLWALRTEMEQLIALDPVKFFRPNPGGQWDFMTQWDCDRGIQGNYLLAGNKTGKTTGAAIIVQEAGLGRPVWGHDFRNIDKTLSWWSEPFKPRKVALFCEDFNSHDEVTVPTLLSWLPKAEVRSIQTGQGGNYVRIYLTCGSVIYLRTYDQGYEKAEGKDYDLVWCDEPPPRDVYTAIWRGLVAEGGRILISATLLKEAWLLDEMELKFIRCHQASTYDNTWLDEQARENFVQLLDEAEKEVRIYGRPTSISGQVFKSFRDDAPWVIPTKDKLHDPTKDEPYPIIMGVDPHERRPVYVEWAFLKPDDTIVWFDWAFIPSGGLEEVFDDIAKKESEHYSSARLVVMDPNRGRAKQIDGRSWCEEFESRGFEVLLADDNVNLGHATLRNMLSVSQQQPVPRMQWMEVCRGKGGPLHQMLRYAWDDWARGTKQQRDPKEKVRQKNKDFPDIHRYVAMADLKFEDWVESGLEPIQVEREARVY